MAEPITSGLAARIADLAVDGSGFVGAALITYGVHLVYLPAGYITAGLFMLTGSWLAARKAI
jgi:hypothetical protein